MVGFVRETAESSLPSLFVPSSSKASAPIHPGKPMSTATSTTTLQGSGKGSNFHESTLLNRFDPLLLV